MTLKNTSQFDVLENTGCFVGKDLFQRMVRTFGTGLLVKKSAFLGVWNRTPCRKTSVNPEGIVKTMRRGKMAVFGRFWSKWLTISCQKRSPCFDTFPMVSFIFCIFSPYTDTHTTRMSLIISVTFLQFFRT